ncbi:MAG: hypothetical protein LBR74_00850 [Eubacterium sp.]|nr:hypothetical protein [Eubacterium sp.]
MNKSSTAIIQEYLDECLFEPGLNWPKYYFIKISYSRWAAYEIITRVLEQELIPPIKVFEQEVKSPIKIIEEFISEMDRFSEITDNDGSQIIFLIASNAAKDILNLYKSKGEKQ